MTARPPAPQHGGWPSVTNFPGEKVRSPPDSAPLDTTRRRATVQYRTAAETLDRSRDHFALERRVSWWRRRNWWGMALPIAGAASGALIALPLALFDLSIWWAVLPALFGAFFASLVRN